MCRKVSRWSVRRWVEGGGDSDAVRNGLLRRRGGRKRGAEQRKAVALLQREEISPPFPRVPRLSPQLATPRFFPPPETLRRDARITFRRRCVCFRRDRRKKPPAPSSGCPHCLPGVFLCPVITASPVTGCNQVVLFASSLLVEEKNTEGRER